MQHSTFKNHCDIVHLNCTHAAQFIADIVNDDGISNDAKILWLHDYIEYVAAWAVSSADKVIFLFLYYIELYFVILSIFLE